MSFSFDIVKIITTKNTMRISPSIKLNPTQPPNESSLIFQTYASALCHHEAFAAMSGAVAQPSAINKTFVNTSGGTLNVDGFADLNASGFGGNTDGSGGVAGDGIGGTARFLGLGGTANFDSDLIVSVFASPGTPSSKI